jgi:hypothetical protein
MEQTQKRGRVTFRKNDIKRSVAAARASGLDIKRIEIGKDGKLSLFVGEQTANGEPAHTDELDQWMEKHNASPA